MARALTLHLQLTLQAPVVSPTTPVRSLPYANDDDGITCQVYRAARVSALTDTPPPKPVHWIRPPCAS
jgi:hypothetical protein